MSYQNEFSKYNASFFDETEEFSTLRNTYRTNNDTLDSIGTCDNTYVRQLEFDKRKLLRLNDHLQSQLETTEQAYNELANQIEHLTKDNVLASELKDENRRLSEVVEEKSQQVHDLTARLKDQKQEEQVLEEKLSAKEYECLALRERTEHLQNVASSQYVCLESAQEEQLRQMATLSAFGNKVEILREKVESIEEKFETVECRMKDLQDEIVFAVAEKKEFEKTVHPLQYDRQQISGCPLQVHRRSHSECFAAHTLPTDNITSNIAEELMNAIYMEKLTIPSKERGPFFTISSTETQSHMRNTKQSLSGQFASQPASSTNSTAVADQNPCNQYPQPGGTIVRNIGNSIIIQKSEQALVYLSYILKLLQPFGLHAALIYSTLLVFVSLCFCISTSLLISLPMQVSRIGRVELSAPFPFSLFVDKIITVSHMHGPPPQ